MEGVGGSTVEAQRITKAKRSRRSNVHICTHRKIIISVEMRKRSLSLVLYGRNTRVTCVVLVSTLKAEEVILRSKNGIGSPMKPTCCLCFKPYCPDLMYIHCERRRSIEASSLAIVLAKSYIFSLCYSYLHAFFTS